ncbi:hypothetical protein IFM89_029798 [Coptis chinensis]|uniref:Uncharacterized protein n=1 Tax=Coptis chinensis TaxID=261450 RepID=A0A835IET6_9MAGN|nr:hypothetical protein IFM89_029798 [Coptis chinensis]
MEGLPEQRKMKQSPPISKSGLKEAPTAKKANETFEKVATFGLLANMILYLTRGYNMDSATGANVLFLWSAASNFTPIFGAFLSDSYLGRFRVIALGSVASLFGGILLWSTTMFPDAKPTAKGEAATPAQLALLLCAFGLMSIGAGGIRPCSLAFGADQLDKADSPNNGRVGFGLPAILIFLSAVFFLLGSPFYIKVKANKSLLTGFIQTTVVAFKNKHLAFPPENADGWYHHRKGSKFVSPTEKLRFLNKACIIRNPDKYLNADGFASEPWKLCTIEQVEELKALIRVIPLWSTGIMIAVTISQHSFPVLQASTMDREVTSGFSIPPGSYGVFGILTLTRMGIGLLISCLAMAVSAMVEAERRKTAIKQGLLNNGSAIVNMSAMWLIPQHCLAGLSEAFNAIGQIDFYYSQFPKSMSSIGVALLH